jgi:purine-binding chemotaxis protein CheW
MQASATPTPSHATAPRLPATPPGTALITPAAPVQAAGLPLELLCFRAGGQEYGLPLRSIQEIRSYQQATPLPGQGAAVLGVLNLRGQVIALLDLRRLLGIPDDQDADAELRAVVVLVQDEQRLGLVVDEVLDVLPVQPERLRLLPQLPGDFAHRHLRGMVSADERRVLLLDPSPWIAAHTSA